MIIQKECPACDGLGKVHSPGHNGDPMDRGLDCAKCDGTGILDVEVDEEGDEI